MNNNSHVPILVKRSLLLHLKVAINKIFILNNLFVCYAFYLINQQLIVILQDIRVKHNSLEFKKRVLEASNLQHDQMKNLEKLVYIVAYVIISQRGVKNFEICTVHTFKDQARSLWMLISNNIKQLHNIWASTKILQDFNLPLYLQGSKTHYINVHKKITQLTSW